MSNILQFKKEGWYWGYLDIDGVIHVKRYVNDRAIENAERSGFTQGIFEPFQAQTLEIAKQMCYEQMHEQRNVHWKNKPNT